MEENIVTPIIEPKKRPVLEIVLIVLVIVSWITAGDLFFRNQKLQKQISKLSIQPAPTAPAETSVKEGSNISDPTANWKTHVNQSYGFQFKYPGEWFDNEGTFYESEKKMLDSEASPYTSLLSVQVNKVNIAKMVSSDPVGTKKLTALNEYTIKTRELKFGELVFSEIKNNKGTFYILDKDNNQIYITYSSEAFLNQKITIDQILSTFKFINPNVETFTSQVLGISFKYLKKYSDGSFVGTKQVGDTVYIYSSNNIAEGAPESGQFVQIFTKDPLDSLSSAIEKKIFGTEFSTKNCTIKPYKNISQAVAINVAGKFNDVSELETLARKCPPLYTTTNGISYFWMDPKYPTKFAFFSIGQYAISGDSDKNTWQDTFRFIP